MPRILDQCTPANPAWNVIYRRAKRPWHQDYCVETHIKGKDGPPDTMCFDSARVAKDIFHKVQGKNNRDYEQPQTSKSISSVIWFSAYYAKGGYTIPLLENGEY